MLERTASLAFACTATYDSMPKGAWISTIDLQYSYQCPTSFISPSSDTSNRRVTRLGSENWFRSGTPGGCSQVSSRCRKFYPFHWSAPLGVDRLEAVQMATCRACSSSNLAGLLYPSAEWRRLAS